MNHKELSLIKSNLNLCYRLIITSRFKNNTKASHIHELGLELMRMYRGDKSKKETQRLCVAMPPRHSKSSMVTLAYPFWLIINNPNLNIVIVNNSGSLSEKFGIKLREYFKEWGHYFNIHLSDVKHSSTYLMFSNEKGELYNGSIRLVGAGGSITGQDADYLIIDDPYSGFEDITPTLLEKKIDWFNTIILQRLEPESRLIILHTRWSENDLQGYLKQNNKDNQYKFLSFPSILPTGESLWPERYTVKELTSKREEMGERLFQAIYQQEPLDQTSDFFNLQKVKWSTKNITKSIIASVRAWDIAGSTSKESDYTSGIHMHLLEDNKTILINDLVYGQYGKNTKNIILQTAEKDTPNSVVLIETGVAAAGKLLYTEWENQLNGFFVKQAMPIKSKIDRATPFQNHLNDGHVIINIHDKKLREKIIRELKSFPDGVHDDIIDSMSHGFNYLNKQYMQAPVLDFIEW